MWALHVSSGNGLVGRGRELRPLREFEGAPGRTHRGRPDPCRGLRHLGRQRPDRVSGEASEVVTASLAAANERAELIMAGTARLAARQLWSAASAMFLTLLPVATVVAGIWMAIAGPFAGVQWAIEVGRQRVARHRTLAGSRVRPLCRCVRAIRWSKVGRFPGRCVEGRRDAAVAPIAEGEAMTWSTEFIERKPAADPTATRER